MWKLFQEVRYLLYGARLCGTFSPHLSLCLRLSFSVFIIPSPFDFASPPSSSWPLIPPVISFLFLISILTPALFSVFFSSPSPPFYISYRIYPFCSDSVLSLVSMLPVLKLYLTLHYIFRMNTYWRTYHFTSSKVSSFSFHFCYQKFALKIF